MKRYLILVVIISLGILPTLNSQVYNNLIRLIDIETGNPIINAKYEYGEQKGYSNQKGKIFFHYVNGVQMKLSHLTYGNWILSDEQIRKAINEGVFFKESKIRMFSPVTVIGVRSKVPQPMNEFSIGYNQKLEHDISSLLNQIPAFNSIRKSGSFGYDPVFRGFANEQLKVVFDGCQFVIPACPNRMDPPTSHFALNMLDRIEIIKGPYSMRYGGGLGATINLIPVSNEFSEDFSFNGGVSFGYESNGKVPKTEAQIGFSNKDFSFNFYGGWSQGADYKSGDEVIVPSSFTRKSFGTKLDFRVTTKQTLSFLTELNQALDVDFPTLPMDLKKDNTLILNLKYNVDLNVGILKSINTSFFGSFVDHVMNNLNRISRMANAETSANTFSFGGRTEATLISDNSNFYIGGEVSFEGAEGFRTREILSGPNSGKVFKDNVWQDSRLNKITLFAEYQNLFGWFNYVISSRLEFNSAEINFPDSLFLGYNPDSKVFQINPSVSIGLLKTFQEIGKIGFWIARAQRSGSLLERFVNFLAVGQDPYEILGNPQVKPEVNNQFDFTFDLSLFKGTSINIDIFAAYLQNYISSIIDSTLKPRLATSPGVRKIINIEKAYKTGFELEWRHFLTSFLSYYLNIAYTYGQDLFRDSPLPQIAPLDIRFTVLSEFFRNKLLSKVICRYVAKQSRIAKEFGELPTPSFFLLDFEFLYKLTNKISLLFGVSNVLDRNYYEHLNRSLSGTNPPIRLSAPGRNIFVVLNISY